MAQYKIEINCFFGFLSPVIPNLNAQSSAVWSQNKRIDKSHWICDYADDIFQTLRETELRRSAITFRSPQSGHRPGLLRLLKTASEKHKLMRTTLHLAIYLLDCFMDNYTIRSDKLNLTAIACLIIAAKLEEADINMPKFVELNKLVGGAYTLYEFKNVEMKVLSSFDFELIRPTAATFAEYFANNIVTLDDYHEYRRNWHNGICSLNQQQREQQQVLLPLYTSYEEMVTSLNGLLFELVDVSLSYLKFTNARPSIIAASCIAALRQMQGITPSWTPYLVETTKYTEDVVTAFKDAMIALYNEHCRDYFVQSTKSHSASTLLDSPDSGILSFSDTKSDTSEDDEDDELDVNPSSILETQITNSIQKSIMQHDAQADNSFANDANNNVEKVEDSADNNHCLEYPPLAKRRKLF